jgi:hypothetical protein
MLSFFLNRTGRTGVLPPQLLLALCLAAALSGCDTGTGTALIPAPPVIQAVAIKSSNTQQSGYMEDQGGAITVTWGAVAGAVLYHVYYAPNITAAPSVPETPAATVTATTAAITGPGIGNNTMNYYVWVKAVNGGGESAPSEPASTLDRFMGTWTAGYGDYYYLSNADVYYDGNYNDSTVLGYIRAVVPFNNGGPVDFNGKTGPAGVIIIEYDKDSIGGDWTWAGDPNYFNAVYYYGLSGSGEGARMCLGNATNIPLYTGSEVSSVEAAIAKFTLAAKDSFVSSSFIAEYEWSE